MSCHVKSWHVTLSHVMSHHFTSCHVPSHHLGFLEEQAELYLGMTDDRMTIRINFSFGLLSYKVKVDRGHIDNMGSARDAPKMGI